MALSMACFEASYIVTNVSMLNSEASKFDTNFADEITNSDPSFSSWYYSRSYFLSLPMLAWCNSMRRLRLEDLEDFWSADERREIQSWVQETLDVLERDNETKDDWSHSNTRLAKDTSIANHAQRNAEQSYEDLWTRVTRWTNSRKPSSSVIPIQKSGLSSRCFCS